MKGRVDGEKLIFYLGRTLGGKRNPGVGGNKSNKGSYDKSCRSSGP